MFENEELKDNQVCIEFMCTHYPPDSACVYFIPLGGSERVCEYLVGEYCMSRVAQVNKMTVMLKKILGR